MRIIPALLLAAIFMCCPLASAQNMSLDVVPAPQKAVLTGQMMPCSSIRKMACEIDSSLPHEGYVLEIGKDSIHIKAGDEAGLFYAMMTLEQQKNARGQYAAGKIEDYPRFAWRGYMLDESRHFFGMEYVKGVLDKMAYFKLNRFHWHLSDSPGWRIEIKKYPKLTEVGAIGNYTDEKAPARFYTQDQIREIVRYAADRHIEVIPEFDMPGHATSACRAYPYLSGGDHPKYPDFTFNVGSERTYSFISDVLDEIFSLFPSRYIHIGGDEVHFGNSCWNDNKDIQALMRREGYTDLSQAEGYFLRKVAEMVRQKGHILIGWDDIIDTGLNEKESVIMWWRQERPDHLLGSLESGKKVILSPRLPLYLDFVQYPGHTQGRHIWAKEEVCCTMSDIYGFPDSNVCGISFSKEQLGNVLGLQGNLWSETVADARRAEYMSWPRMCAISESAWTLPGRKDYADFERRMEQAYRYLDLTGTWYFDYRNPARRQEPPSAEKAIEAD